MMSYLQDLVASTPVNFLFKVHNLTRLVGKENSMTIYRKGKALNDWRASLRLASGGKLMSQPIKGGVYLCYTGKPEARPPVNKRDARAQVKKGEITPAPFIPFCSEILVHVDIICCRARLGGFLLVGRRASLRGFLWVFLWTCSR